MSLKRFRRTAACTLVAAAALAGWATIAPAAAGLTFLEAQRAMAGHWAGDGTTLVVDVERLQANIDPNRPFDWRTLRIVDVTGAMVVFDVGTMRFVGLFQGRDALRITGVNFPGERVLHIVKR